MATATLELQVPPRHAFSSSFSASTSNATSLLDNLSISSFGFDDLRAQMNAFTQKFDDFIEQGRRRVLEERNQFRMSIAQVQEAQTTTTNTLSTLHLRSTTHNATLTSQAAETAEYTSAITSLTSIRDSHFSAVDSVRQRLASTRAALAAKKATLKKDADYRSEMAQGDDDELRTWEELLGMRVEGVGIEDRVRFYFVFNHLNTKRQAEIREAWFELEMPDPSGKRQTTAVFRTRMSVVPATASYAVVGSEPKLEGEEVERCLAGMEDGTEDLAGFLKGMREIMRRAVDV